MKTTELLSAYNEWAAADAKADAAFDLLNFPNLPERQEMSTQAKAGEIIHRRGSLRAALVEAQAGIENPDCSEQLKETYQLVIEAAQ